MDTRERILKLMEDNQMTKYRLAKEIGISNGIVSDWANGKSTSYTKYIDKIAKIFNVSVDYLMTGEEPELGYFIDDEAKEIAQELAVRPDLKILFDTTRKVSAEDLKLIIQLVEKMEKQ